MIENELRITLKTETGAVLDNARIVFHTSKARRGRVIWICHALTANSNPEDWWPEMVGRGKTIDPERDFVVCVNIPGSAYGSESPRSIDPSTGRPRLLSFPAITFRDIVRALAAVRKALEIEHVDLLVGSSIGGYQAIEWAITEPDVFRRCLFIATAPRISPYLGASVETQRMALEADPSFREAASIEAGAAGLKCARAQALISYRCFEGYGITQAEDDQDTLFAGKVASYQRYQGEKLVKRQFDAYCYYTLCNAMDSHNAGRGRGGVKAALRCIKARCTVVSIDTDCIFPPAEGREWAAMIPGARHIEISSKFGHDGFLLETGKLSAIIME